MRNNMRPPFCLARQKDDRSQGWYLYAKKDAQSGKLLRLAGKVKPATRYPGHGKTFKQPDFRNGKKFIRQLPYFSLLVDTVLCEAA